MANDGGGWNRQCFFIRWRCTYFEVNYQKQNVSRFRPKLRAIQAISSMFHYFSCLPHRRTKRRRDVCMYLLPCTLPFSRPRLEILRIFQGFETLVRDPPARGVPCTSKTLPHKELWVWADVNDNNSNNNILSGSERAYTALHPQNLGMMKKLHGLSSKIAVMATTTGGQEIQQQSNNVRGTCAHPQGFTVQEK